MRIVKSENDLTSHLSAHASPQLSDLVMPEALNWVTPDRVDREKARDDIETLIYAFQKAYAGYRFVDPSLTETAFNQLRRIALEGEGAIDQKQFCTAVADAIYPIPDNHISVLNQTNGPKSRCGSLWQKNIRLAGVGKNVGTRDNPAASDPPWSIHWKNTGQTPVPVLAITSFPPSNDSRWNGYSEAIQELLSAQEIIVDLRSNGGGDDARGFQLASLLIGEEPSGRGLLRLHYNQTPEAFTAAVNIFQYMRFNYINSGLDPAPLDSIIADTKRQFNLALQGQIPSFRTEEAPQKAYLPNQVKYKGRIYALIDSRCGSSCESSLEALMAHPMTVTVGENTAGVKHFCPIGLVVLPHSKVAVTMGSKYNEYDRFLERIGHTPDIPVEAGKDALERVLSMPVGQ